MLIEHVIKRHIIHDLRHLSDYKLGIMNMTLPGEEVNVVCDTTTIEVPLSRK